MSCHRENLHLCCAENPGRECMVMRNFTCISIICLKSASAAREMENMYLDEDIYQYHDGDITFIPENFPHVTVSYGEVVNFWEYIFIDIHSVIEEMFPNNAAFQNEAVTTISKKAFMTNVYQSPAMAEYINAIIRETSEHKIYCQRTVKLLVQGIVIELLRRYDELPEEDNNIVKGTNMSQIATALDYMNKHYSESIKAGELSELCNMSETHFRRLFESYINMPPMEYLNLIRVQKACELMKKQMSLWSLLHKSVDSQPSQLLTVISANFWTLRHISGR